MTRVLTQMALACVLASSVGAAPGQRTSDSRANDTPQSQMVAKATTGSAHQSTARKVVEVPKKSEAKPYQVGNASWYGEMFQGKETASGEAYDMYRYTAAHMQLPLGTWVKVTNLKNNQFVVVRINDRGPVTPGRIIDLSYSAARSINMAGRGLAKVRIDVLPNPASTPKGSKPTVLEAGLH
jgi:rare lipoprotein A